MALACTAGTRKGKGEGKLKLGAPNFPLSLPLSRACHAGYNGPDIPFIPDHVIQSLTQLKITITVAGHCTTYLANLKLNITTGGEICFCAYSLLQQMARMLNNK